MSALSSPIIGVMLRAVRKSSKVLVRDFNELRHLRSSYVAASEFTRAAYQRSGKVIAEGLKEYKQGLGVLIEGSREPKELGELFWYISPIDSRTNFMSGLPYFASTVALVKEGEVVAAVVDAPVLRETYHAEKGFGTFYEDTHSRYIKMHVSKRESTNAMVVDFTAGCQKARALTEELAKGHVVLRSAGSVILGFSYLCAAYYDVLIYSGLQSYKAGIGKLFVEGSKGSFGQYGDGVIVAGNFFLRDFVEKKLREIE